LEIIGREKEIQIFERCEHSDKPEFLAVYGRRRVGKTYLISEYFRDRFAFSVSGVANENKQIQLRAFHRALGKHFHGEIPFPSDWFDAFDLLEDKLSTYAARAKKTIFIDELPWLDTPKSGFLSALEHFWNSFVSRRPDILLIVCGSAASWMIRNLINNYGGLHNRVTERIVLEPFTLGECERFYRSRGIAYTRQQTAEAYMILGGIPFYMDGMDKMYGLNQNIDLLLFEKNAKLDGEFDRLYHSLFRHVESPMRIVSVLADTGMGLARQEISKKSDLSDGGGLTKAIDELESCGLIERYYDIHKKRNGEYFKLIDFYTLFYFKYLHRRKNRDPHFWTNYLTDPAHIGWCGYAFERLCRAHVPQIKQRLGISGVITETYAFRSNEQSPGAQIDLLIDRKDDTINLCEIKYAGKPYILTGEDIEGLERKSDVFLRDTGTKKSIHLTMIAANGIAHNKYRNYIQSEVTLDDLFRDA
jgi:AAA+ ATPase superfamily predicted ATPase